MRAEGASGQSPARPDSSGTGTRSRRTTCVALSLIWRVVWLSWLAGMVSGGRWGLFRDNFFMSLTMAVGSFIAGATSEGGGAVAFPVMTLGFGIAPPVARDFSLMIQAVGMTAAGFTILFTGIEVERRALLWSSIGGALGIVLGLEQVAPRMTPAYAKMFFTATWLSFAFALFWINRYREREVHVAIHGFGSRQALLLLVTGVAPASEFLEDFRSST